MSTTTTPATLATPDELDFGRAQAAYSAMSFRPEARARSEQESFAQAVNGLFAELLPLASTPAQQVVLRAEVERYKAGYLSNRYKVLAASSRCMSWVITGPAKFPVARNQKRMDIHERRAREFLDWNARARAAVKRAVLAARTAEQLADDDWQKLAAEIRREVAFVAALDRGEQSGFDRSLFVTSLAGKLQRLAKNGRLDLVRKALDLVSEIQAASPKPFFSARHRIWALIETAEQVSATPQRTGTEIVSDCDGIQVIKNHTLDRVQIIFPGKPSESIREQLRGAGWKWSPTQGAWQRKLTDNALHSAQRITALA